MRACSGGHVGSDGGDDRAGSRGRPRAKPSRRRKMNIKLKHVRHALTSSTGDAAGPFDSMVRLFAESARSAAPAAALLTLGVGAAAQFWAPPQLTLAWMAASLAMIGARYGLGARYLNLPNPESRGRASIARCSSRCNCSTAPPGPAGVLLLLTSADPERARLHAGAADADRRHDRDDRLGDSRRGRRRPRADHGRDRCGRSARARRRDFALLARALRRRAGLFHRARQPPVAQRARRPVVPGGEGRADRRAGAGQIQFRRGAPARRERQSRQIALSGDDEPRIAHAAQRDPRLFRSDEGRAVRRRTPAPPTRNMPATSIPAASIC